MSEATDLLCIAAHPDDVEISMAGTVISHVEQGFTVGIVDLTAGELGTRGSPELRRQEAEAARMVLGAGFRYQAGLPDGFIQEDEASLLKVVAVIRRHKPRVVLTNAVRDRHPDHGRAAALVARACFLSGLRKVVTTHHGAEQEAWRPVTVLHAVQDRWVDPDLVVDITPHWGRKMEALRCFRSQFHDPASKEPESPIARADYLPLLEGRAREMGRLLMVTYGEGFTTARSPGIRDLTTLL
ncbi:MAG: bacillithiol biosynthesis deacetylase BshB1 [Flavobacteriales bacterium]|nr:bacillithiol biosynthesis deacetylase BshB1 [Flavobacteriales bacterium]